MKKAFTLIELLVVIAIIAILAAILFPVFAQAKSAAKKATSISNQKQLSLAIMMYAENYDDLYPRQDDCVLNSSLNSSLNNKAAGTNPIPFCTGPFPFRINHYKWQRWIQPYMKSVDVCFHPAMQKVASAWNDNGEIMNGYALNLALTGALNTWQSSGGSSTANGAIRTSWLGGTQTAVPDVANAMLIMELASPSINFAPVFLDSSSGTTERRAYPPAIRELWRPMYFKQTSAPCNYGNEIEPTKAPFAGSIVLSYTDGHSKAVNVNKFLSDTPTAAEYQVSSRWPCAPDGGAWTISAPPVWTRSWPLWALQ